MGSGGSALKEASAQQVQEAFAGLSAEEQKKALVADALVIVSKSAADAPADAPTPGLSDEQRAMLKAAYADIDTNKSGTIEVAEFKCVMQKMKVQLTDEQIEGVFKRADLNKDQKLSYEEYEKLVVKGLEFIRCRSNAMGNGLQGEFVFDDMYAVVQNPDVYSSQPWTALFQHDFWGFPLESEKSHKSYRPLTTLTFRWQMIYANDGADLLRTANVMHKVNVFLHGLNSGLLVILFNLLGFSMLESFIASLLFACQPVHVEAVASLVGRSELLAALSTICSVILWHIPWLWPLSFAVAACALFCKETAAVVALPMCSCLQFMDLSRKKYSKRCHVWHILKALPPLILLLALLTLRLHLNGGPQARYRLVKMLIAKALRFQVSKQIIFCIYLALVLLLFVWSRTCLEYSKAWWTAERLYRWGLEANPRNEKLHDLLATRLQNSGGNLEEARWHAERAISLNADYWHAHATLGQLRSAANLKSSAIQHYQTALFLAEKQGLDDVADAPKVRLNLAVMLQDVNVESAEFHFRRLCSMQVDVKAMALVIFGAFLESFRSNSSRLSEAAAMYEQAVVSPGPHESVAHLRLGSAIRRIAASSAGEVQENRTESKLAKHPGKTTWRDKFPSSCSDDDADAIPKLVSVQTWAQLAHKCWLSDNHPPKCSKEDMSLVQIGLRKASAPNSQPLDPGGRKWREAMAIVGSRQPENGSEESMHWQSFSVVTLRSRARPPLPRAFGAATILCLWTWSISVSCFASVRRSKLPSVSVQIATYNRPSLLLEALHQIEVQDYAGQIEALMFK
eukprot:Skav230831  [mRNA]  locus=scaffold3318:6455:21416:+ [translate_table: standard]